MSKSIKKEFDSESIYIKKYLRIQIKSYSRKISTNFQNNKVAKEGSQCIFQSVIMIDSVFKIDKSHYPQVYLEECKYVVKE